LDHGQEANWNDRTGELHRPGTLFCLHTFFPSRNTDWVFKFVPGKVGNRELPQVSRREGMGSKPQVPPPD
jgi:hypothetical protein